MCQHVRVTNHRGGGKANAMYEAPTITVMGALNELTLGGPFSRCDGMSGDVGNNGVGNPLPPCPVKP